MFYGGCGNGEFTNPSIAAFLNFSSVAWTDAISEWERRFQIFYSVVWTGTQIYKLFSMSIKI